MTTVTEMLFDAGFHLCGSRALDLHTIRSDWDFVGADGQGTRSFLEDLGFKDITLKPKALDCNTLKIYERGGLTVLVQVVLVRDLPARLRVLQAMKDSPELAALDRNLRKQPGRISLINTLYRLTGIK